MSLLESIGRSSFLEVYDCISQSLQTIGDTSILTNNR